MSKEEIFQEFRFRPRPGPTPDPATWVLSEIVDKPAQLELARLLIEQQISINAAEGAYLRGLQGVAQGHKSSG